MRNYISSAAETDLNKILEKQAIAKRKKKHAYAKKPLILCDRSWVAADAFVGMGVTIGEGAVVGARSAVFKDVEPWTVVGGNPAKFIKKRIIKNG